MVASVKTKKHQTKLSSSRQAKMFSDFSFPSFISFLLLIIMLFRSPSFGAADPKFTNCSQPFNCGNINNISYPFWGHSRAEYCGLPGYELKCENGSAEIVIQSQSYRVLDISKHNNTLRIATMDFWNGNCPSRFVNISLPSNLFNYSLPSTQNLTLFYGCPLISQLIPTNRFNCSIYDINGENYFWFYFFGLPPQDVSRCNITVMVPVLKPIVQSFKISQSTLDDVVKKGFDVGYVMNVTFCNKCEASGGLCGYNTDIGKPTCFCNNAIDALNQEGVCNGLDVMGLFVAVLLLVFLGIPFVIGACVTAVLCCCCKRVRRSTNCIMFWKRKQKDERVVENFLTNYGSSVPKRYTYSEIKKITSSFKDKIGQGGFGGVYKGKLVDGRLVAVKLLNKAKGDGQEFINEVASISRTSHVNIVSLVGFCFGVSKRALIYEFMANGSLEKFIYDRNPLEAELHLGWEKLYQIVVGVARGLEYLHRGCSTRILHFDIKPHNILLDQDFTPKISDFGLAKLCPRNESIISMFDARGTVGYIAPELFSKNFGGVSHKSDVYSYGMMVLEIVGKRKNIDVGVDHTSEIYFPHWIYKRIELDEDLGLHGVMSNEEGKLTRKMILVALWCIQPNPVERPSMSNVVEMLEGQQNLLSLPPQPFLSSPARNQAGSANT